MLRQRSAPLARALLGALLLLTSALHVSPLRAEAPSRPPVSPLPTPLDARLPAPDAASLARLDELLARLSGASADQRRSAHGELVKVDASWLPALAVRLETIADRADKLAMKSELSRLRDAARVRREAEPGNEKGADDLELLLDAEPSSARTYEALVHVLALSRMFEHIGSVAAGKQLIRVYVRFGEFLRVDTERALERLGERAIAPLIESTRHPAPQIARWAEERLEAMGKAQPSDAVQVSSSAVLSDVLRAYGKNRRLDTARLSISFAQSQRPDVRRAAREAVTLLGSAGSWPLRDAYEKTLGVRAPEDWSWDRTARELFAEYDRRRLLDVYALFDSGRAALARGDLVGARDTFDRVLGADPTFQHGSVMAETYLTFARAHADRNPAEARLALSRVERLVPEGELHGQAESLRYTLEAEALLADGIVDQVLLRRAVESDPGNQRARTLLEGLAPTRPLDPSPWQRYRAVGLIALLAMAAATVLRLRHRRRDRDVQLAPSARPPPPPSSSA